MRSYSWVVILTATSLLGCARHPTITDGAEDVPTWNRQLQAAIPIGTPIARARRTLEDNGFHCVAAVTMIAAAEKTDSTHRPQLLIFNSVGLMLCTDKYPNDRPLRGD